MRVLKRSPWLTGLALMLAFVALAGTRARADVTTDVAGSIVIFPKVIADGTRDTLIQITNTSNLQRTVHCLYVNASGACQFNPGVQCQVASDCPDFATANEQCELIWLEENFSIVLTRQQPTIWRVSTGRRVDPTDPANGQCEDIPGAPTLQDCPGIDPGQIIPPVQPFRGELKCFETDESEAPFAANSLKGEAIIETLGSNQISIYNSINIQGTDNNDGNLALELDNTEYNACPLRLEVVHHSSGATDPVTSNLDPSACEGAGCPVRTEITLIPCTQLFENQIGAQVTANIFVFDEFEFPISVFPTVDCWFNQDVANINGGIAFTRGSTFVKTEIQSQSGRRCIAGPLLNQQGCTTDADCGGAAAGGVCGPASGLLAVVEEFHETNATQGLDPTQFFGTAAVDVHMIPGRRGFCRVGGPTAVCDEDADCQSGGLCRSNGVACTSSAECVASSGLPQDFCDICLMDVIQVPDLNLP